MVEIRIDNTGRVREALWRKLRDQYLNVEAEIEIER